MGWIGQACYRTCRQPDQFDLLSSFGLHSGNGPTARWIPSARQREVSTLAKKKRKTVTVKVGRDARTGRFIPVKTARRRKSTAVVETIKRKKK